MSNRAPRPLADVIERLVPTLAPATTLARVLSVWQDAVGPAIASEAQPASERDGVLTVRCAAAVWAQELELMADELLARLNARLGEHALRELRCRTG